MNQIVILTTDKKVLKWKSLFSKKLEIVSALNQAENSDFHLDVIYADLEPEVKEGRITHRYMDSISYDYYQEGYDFVAVHMTDVQRKKWEIKPSLRGSYHNDDDFVGEMYFWSNENTKRNGLNQFVETFLHEMSHALAKGSDRKDHTHDYHDENKSIKGIFKAYDMDEHLPRRTYLIKKKTLLEGVLELLRLRKKYLRPLPEHWTDVSQKYGQRDADLYKKTKHHIGTDFRAPLGTNLIAPADMNIVRTGYSETLGYWCECKVDDWYLICLHLAFQPPRMLMKRGWIFAQIGNTGKIRGIHSHIEDWDRPRDISLLTEDNFRQYTKDITKRIP